MKGLLGSGRLRRGDEGRESNDNGSRNQDETKSLLKISISNDNREINIVTNRTK